MLPWLLQPLAANDGLGAVAFFVIWALIVVVSQYQKWQQKTKQRQQTMLPAPPPLPPEPRLPSQRPSYSTQQPHRRPPVGPAPVRRPPVANRPVQRPPALQQPTRPLPPRPAALPPLPAKAVETTSAHYAPSAATAELDARMKHEVGSEAATKTGRPAITAAELSRALRPQMLRRSFILTELLAPPLGLRDLQSAEGGSSTYERTSERPA